MPSSSLLHVARRLRRPPAAVRRTGRSLAAVALVAVAVPYGPAGTASPRVEITVTELGDLSSPPVTAASHSEGEHSADDRQLQSASERARAAAAADVRVPLRDGGQMVALEWDGDAELVELQVRTADGWSAPVELAASIDEGPDPGLAERPARDRAVGPVWVGHGVEEVAVDIEGGAARRARFHELRSVEPRSRPFAVAAASATPARPGILSRAEWGADESIRNSPSGCEGGPSYAENVQIGFVHHTVSTNSYAANEADDLIRGIYAFHVRSRGYCDIGYNFLVDRFGRAWEGRWGGVDRAVIGAHTGGFNSYSTGVALLGDHTGVGVTSAARTALVDLLAWKLGHHGVDARSTVTLISKGSTKYSNGTPVALAGISGHRDVSATACPGGHAYNLLPGLRADVAARVLASKPYPMAGYRPQSGAPRLVALNAWGGVPPRGGQTPVDGPYWHGWPIARAVVATGPTTGYVVDGWGGLHPIGSATAVAPGGYFPGSDVMRSAAPGPTSRSGYVLDAFGGIYPFGDAAHRRLRVWSWDIARAIATGPGGTGGYVLDGWGGVHAFGTAPPMRATGYWAGWDIARDLAVLPDGSGGYVLDGWGGLHPFGSAKPMKVSHYTAGHDAHRAIILNRAGTGGWVLDLDGWLWPFGDAGTVRSPHTWTGSGIGRDLARFPEDGERSTGTSNGGLAVPTA